MGDLTEAVQHQDGQERGALCNSKACVMLGLNFTERFHKFLCTDLRNVAGFDTLQGMNAFAMHVFKVSILVR